MAAPTSEEIEILKQFRIEVADILLTDEHLTDAFLMRWLRAREMNIAKATTMIRNSFKWRREHNVNNVINIVFDNFFTENYPYNIDGLDREGRVVLIYPCGKWNISKVVELGKQDEYISYVNQFFERILAAIRKSKNLNNSNFPHTQFTAIVDFDGFSMSQMANIGVLKNVLKVAQTYEAHYPEILYTAFFVNCSTAFTAFYKLLKPILAEKTVSKLTICGNTRSDWELLINKVIDPEEIKMPLGGKTSS